ncbi:uncharacterized protein AKAW2_50346A [Aspergillus luchuensis]|uniref:Uncharacterized protein n=1 Tax=Aspergillus kawachii TaxID=1069201 RepID=A0A7R7WC08_ASPKA|nr:uncharacterized protein AKAW2_50346A [Aspergillus luchuensis]BCS00005.1 hypothetical protein AKAW2_50346A [Aspergillus luchuensis]
MVTRIEAACMNQFKVGVRARVSMVEEGIGTYARSEVSVRPLPDSVSFTEAAHAGLHDSKTTQRQA